METRFAGYFKKSRRALQLLCTAFFVTTGCAKKNDLPPGFVYLYDIDPNIIQDVRYSTSENFLSRPVPGYTVGKIICTKEAAQSLAKVNQALNQQGYKLVVYDGYRPQRAVDAFFTWSLDVNDQQAKTRYYPTIDKKDVFDLDYVAKKSTHTRGSTFDLTIIPIDQKLKPITLEKRILSNGEEIPFLNDNTVDMGASFDLFHEVSHHDTPLITTQQTTMRNILRAAMKKQGFTEYPTEWWHYTLSNEPYPDTYFNFVIK